MSLVWEFRPDGNAHNGCGWDSSLGGTDYSQSATPLLSLTDVAGTSTTTLSSATGGFTSAMAGNGFYVVGQGLFIIESVTDAHHVVVDRTTATFSGATGNVGGAGIIDNSGFSPPQGAGFLGAGIAGEILWVRGTDSSGAASSYTTSGQLATGNALVGNPCAIYGYGTTRGDGQRAIIKSSYSAAGSVLPGASHLVQNLTLIDASAAGNANGLLVAGDKVNLENVQLVGKAASTNGILFWLNAAGPGSNTVRSCYFDANGNANPNHIAECRAAGALFKDCTFTNFAAPTGQLALSITEPTRFKGCVFYNNSGAGALVKQTANTFGAQFQGCVFWNNGGDVVQIQSGEGLMAWSFRDCIFGKNAGSCVNYTATDESATVGAAQWQAVMNTCNFFYDTGSGGRYHNLPANVGDTTLTADPFTDSAAGDFSLNSLSGGGLLITGTPCSTTLPTAIPAAGGTATESLTVTEMAGPYGLTPAPSSTVTMRSLWRELTNERSTVAVPDSVVDIYLDWGLQALNRASRYHYTTDTTTLALVAAQQEYAAPADLVEILWIRFGIKELQKSSIDRWRGDDLLWASEPAGEPREWAQYGLQVVLRPAPSAEAVAANATCTMRYVSNPPSVTTSGPEQLAASAWRLAVVYGAMLWSLAYPDTALAQQRAQGLKQEFVEGAQLFQAEMSARDMPR